MISGTPCISEICHSLRYRALLTQLVFYSILLFYYSYLLISHRKTWELYYAEVNIENGQEVLIKQDLSVIAPQTFEGQELIIPPRSLSYGTYKIKFIARMWDATIADPNWTQKFPFINDAFTYIKAYFEQCLNIVHCYFLVAQQLYMSSCFFC